MSKISIYDTKKSASLTIKELQQLFTQHNIQHIFFKRLASNDNSKNQIYAGSHLTDLDFIPSGDVTGTTSESKKQTKRKIIYKAPIQWSWMSPYGELYEAPNTQFIYYPQYPEVRLSGFLQGSNVNLSQWMCPKKNGRHKDRVLFLGIKGDKVIAYFATPHSEIFKAITAKEPNLLSSVFEEIAINKLTISSKKKLLIELQRIHRLGWINSKRLNSKGQNLPYTAQNGGGYTLEAELGITPNGSKDPDYHGWEVKQYNVTSFGSLAAKPLTLMTPEPDGGVYVESGIINFMKQYGYLNPKKTNRLDFTGKHAAHKVNKKTQLMFTVHGFDSTKKDITDANGYIGLVDRNQKVVASWSFTKILDHWKNKHNKAVYIPSINRVHNNIKQYHYGHIISLFKNCNIILLLTSFSNGTIYYDPGIKMENIDTDAPKTKRRSQFRVSSKNLNQLYEQKEEIDLNCI
tara:strand:+ start:686 stop:2065 length:1380 start_codon:yes stop_codon:yes gene_type:complete